MKASILVLLLVGVLGGSDSFAGSDDWLIKSIVAGPDARIELSPSEMNDAQAQVKKVMDLRAPNLVWEVVNEPGITKDALVISLSDTKLARLLKVTSTYERYHETDAHCVSALADAHLAIGQMGSVLFAIDRVACGSGVLCECYVEAIVLQGVQQQAKIH